MKTKTKHILKWLGLIVLSIIIFFVIMFLLAFPANGSFKAVVGYCQYEDLNETFLQLEILLAGILVVFIYALECFTVIRNHFKPYAKFLIVFLLLNVIFVSIHVFWYPILERSFSFGLGRTVNLLITPYFIISLVLQFLLIIISWRCYKLFAQKGFLFYLSSLISIGCIAIVFFTVNNSSIEAVRCYG